GPDVLPRIVANACAHIGWQALSVPIDAADVIRLEIDDLLRVAEGFPGRDRDESEQHRVGDADRTDYEPGQLIVRPAKLHVDHAVKDREADTRSTCDERDQNRPPQPRRVVIDPVANHSARPPLAARYRFVVIRHPHPGQPSEQLRLLAPPRPRLQVPAAPRRQRVNTSQLRYSLGT